MGGTNGCRISRAARKGGRRRFGKNRLFKPMAIRQLAPCRRGAEPGKTFGGLLGRSGPTASEHATPSGLVPGYIHIVNRGELKAGPEKNSHGLITVDIAHSVSLRRSTARIPSR